VTGPGGDDIEARVNRVQALREIQLEQGEGFATVHTGMSQIVALIPNSGRGRP
jgi:hypothetical protein